MSLSKIKEKVLIVEGKEDLRVIPELIERGAGINWIVSKKPVIYINDLDGVDQLNESVITANIKASGLKIIGIIVDADDSSENRWHSIRTLFISNFPNLPEEIPEDGFIVTNRNEDDIKFGAWIMPDNKNNGMLETFLEYLVPNHENDAVWEYAKNTVQEVKALNSTERFKDAHTDKANIYSWLAWQNPPGRQLHDAIKQKILKPDHPKAQPFIKWFLELYELELTG